MPATAPLSYSSLRTYSECPQRWKFLYVDKLPETPRGYFAFGRTIHSVLETVVRPYIVPQARKTPTGRQRILEDFSARSSGPPDPSAPTVPLDMDGVRALLDKLWSSEGYTSAEEEAKYRTLGVEILEQYFEEFSAHPPTPIAVEEHLEATWDGLPVHGYIDRIDLRPDGGLDVIDYKTGRGLTQQDAAESDQLSLYQVLVENNFERPVTSLSLIDLRGGHRLSVPRREAKQLEPLQRKAQTVVDGIRAEAFEPTPGRYCQRCDFRPICPVFRELAGADRERLALLVDQFQNLRIEADRLDGELRRVAEQLHQEAERLDVRQLAGTGRRLVRHREETWTFHPASVRPLLEAHRLTERTTSLDEGAIRGLLSDPTLDPELRRTLERAGSRSVRWYWEFDSSAEPTPRKG
ncbi:MAG: PD-(D/E)XK nuclease family protein [Thermoplasmata archaeon]|nr:PD-(D/E)XK nuclease family protein [Thermoplasmata archaeon]